MSCYYTELDMARGAQLEAEEMADKDELKFMDEVWNEADNADVGSTIYCANCGESIEKTTYHKKFCSTKCKDKFWNKYRGINQHWNEYYRSLGWDI